MKKVLLVSQSASGERAEYAKYFFDEMNKLAALFMMYTHGIGRWPSSRTALCECTSVSTVSGEQCAKADYIVILKSKASDIQKDAVNILSHKDYKGKTQDWFVDGKKDWDQQKEIIKDYVRELVILCDESPYVKKASDSKLVTFEEFIKCSNFRELQKLLSECEL